MKIALNNICIFCEYRSNPIELVVNGVFPSGRLYDQPDICE